MANWGMNLLGLSRTVDRFKEIQARFDGDVVYLVGSNVEYALWQEVGTSSMEPQPYLRPAVREWQRSPEGFIVRNTKVNPDDLDSLEEMVRVSALAIERRASEMSPVDTGNLQASVKSVRLK